MGIKINHSQSFGVATLSSLKPGAVFRVGGDNSAYYVKGVFSQTVPSNRNCIQCKNLQYCLCLRLETGTVYFFETDTNVYEYDVELSLHRAMKEEHDTLRNAAQIPARC